MRLPTEDEGAALDKKVRPNNDYKTVDPSLPQSDNFKKAKQKTIILLQLRFFFRMGVAC